MRILAFSLLALCAGCTNSNTTVPTTSKLDPPASEMKYQEAKQSTRMVDSFLAAHSSEIGKNAALREQYEASFTKQLLPLIDKKGLYNDLPFKLVATTTNNGKAYGNFVYEDDRHFAKVQCIVKPEQLSKLSEDSTYRIRFKTYKFEDGFSFQNSFSKIELPTVNAHLTSFEPWR